MNPRTRTPPDPREVRPDADADAEGRSHEPTSADYLGALGVFHPQPNRKTRRKRSHDPK